MKDTKAGQLIGLIIAAIFTGGMIYFIKDSGSAASIAMTFTGIVGVFIGLDIAVMIKRTSGMPMGFREINKQRYIAGLVIFSFLLAEAFFISGVLGRNCDSLYTSFGMGFLIIIGGLIAGVEGNKIVTKNDDPVSPEKQ
jgi:xanthosine utilization system XapX-like protein